VRNGQKARSRQRKLAARETAWEMVRAEAWTTFLVRLHARQDARSALAEAELLGSEGSTLRYRLEYRLSALEARMNADARAAAGARACALRARFQEEAVAHAHAYADAQSASAATHEVAMELYELRLEGMGESSTAQELTYALLRVDAAETAAWDKYQAAVSVLRKRFAERYSPLVWDLIPDSVREYVSTVSFIVEAIETEGLAALRHDVVMDRPDLTLQVWADAGFPDLQLAKDKLQVNPEGDGDEHE